MPDGRLLFARYALAPNRLGYCGGPETEELLDYCVAGASDPGIDRLIRQFQAAYPYLQFIARSSGTPDPLDPKVVEAYWLGNGMLQSLEARDFYQYVDEQVGHRIPERLKKYVVGKVPQGARPNHTFHVFDVSMRTGALREDVETLDNCRISWGVVENVGDGVAGVRHRPLVLSSGKLTLGAPVLVTARRKMLGRGYLDDLAPGAVVSMHWNWICDRISPSQARALERETERHLRLANLTI